MTREEVLFDVWFSLYERRNFTSLAPDAFGHRAVMLEAWKARASLHIVENKAGAVAHNPALSIPDLPGRDLPNSPGSTDNPGVKHGR